MKWITHDLNHYKHFTAHTFNCVCHCIKSMFRVLGVYNFGYQLKSTANSAHFALFLGKWAKLAVPFSWWLQNGPQDFNFFNCPWCRIFILCEIPKSWHNNSFLGSVRKCMLAKPIFQSWQNQVPRTFLYVNFHREFIFL